MQPERIELPYLSVSYITPATITPDRNVKHHHPGHGNKTGALNQSFSAPGIGYVVPGNR